MKYLIRMYKQADERFNNAVFYDYIGRKGEVMTRSANVCLFAKSKGYSRKSDCTRLINKLIRTYGEQPNIKYEIVRFKA